MTPDSYWIFNKSYKDFLFLVLPAYITIIVAKIIHPTSWVDMVVLFIVFHVIDSGHVYLTFYRTHGHRQERASQSYYLWAPPLILITCALWYLSGGLYFWSFVTYSTLYHNLRQFYGITRWYQKKEGNFSPWPTRFLYSLMITPAVGFHFRNLGELSIYNRQEVFYHPNLTYYKISLAIFMLAMLSWLVYESFCYFKNNRQWSPGRVLSVLTPAAAYSSGLFFGDNYLQIIGPMIVAHGIGYWALMGFSMNRTFANPRSFFKRNSREIFKT